jgi:CRISPR-associated protein (TIGR02710 family)
VRAHCDRCGTRHATVITRDENDLDRCTTQYVAAIAALLDDGFGPDDLVCDLTTGTKVMAAALALAAVQMQAGCINYVYGERGPTGIVQPGTERVAPVYPRRLYLRPALRRAVDHFNHGRYAACEHELDGATGFAAGAHAAAAQIACLAGLTRAYRAWDHLDYRAAKELLVGVARTDALAAQWLAVGQLERHKRLVHQLATGDLIAWDIWRNADRRAVEGRYDDAVARGYRFLECLAQDRLRRVCPGLQTANVDVALLPLSLRPCFSDVRQGDSGKIVLDLRRAYALLGDLGDGLGRAFAAMWEACDSRLRQALSHRNSSVLAHGLTPTTAQSWSVMRGVMESLAREADADWGTAVEQGTFPQLDFGTVSHGI